MVVFFVLKMRLLGRENLKTVLLKVVESITPGRLYANLKKLYVYLVISLAKAINNLFNNLNCN
jgi:hypothetical protein